MVIKLYISKVGSQLLSCLSSFAHSNEFSVNVCSVTIWDPSLGQPCVRQISSHSRCINTVLILNLVLQFQFRLILFCVDSERVLNKYFFSNLSHWLKVEEIVHASNSCLIDWFQVAISPKDQFICTGGDDQKVVSSNTLSTDQNKFGHRFKLLMKYWLEYWRSVSVHSTALASAGRVGSK